MAKAKPRLRTMYIPKEAYEDMYDFRDAIERELISLGLTNLGRFDDIDSRIRLPDFPAPYSFGTLEERTLLLVEQKKIREGSISLLVEYDETRKVFSPEDQFKQISAEVVILDMGSDIKEVERVYTHLKRVRPKSFEKADYIAPGESKPN